MMTRSRRFLGAAAALAATFGAGFATNVALADQPMMHKALDDLRSARDHLERADTDKGGHRLAAIRAVDAAMGEVRAGIGFDRTH